MKIRNSLSDLNRLIFIKKQTALFVLWKDKIYESNIIYRWCCPGKPGRTGGYGAVLQFIDSTGKLHERELSAGYRKTTNNRMELMAAIVGLEALVKPCQVELYSDSKYLTDAFNQHWIDGWLKRGWKKSDKSPVKTKICGADFWRRWNRIR